MSIVHVDQPAIRVADAAAVALPLRIRWSVAPPSLASSADDRLRRLTDGGTCTRAELRIDVDADGSTSASLECSGEGQPPKSIALCQHTPRAAVLLDSDAALAHIEAPGVLSATRHLDRVDRRVAYARTPILERLGIAGGRYDLITD